MIWTDPFGALCGHGRVERFGVAGGPLAGLAFAVKDLFHVAGVPTAAGSPAWLATHAPPALNAVAVDVLLAAGARLTGKTRTDEMAYSLSGDNAHYGAPTNPAAPDRLPGGSSSGSAVAVASGLVPFALGSDTGGSVRLPGSFCGILGFRPTHGRIPVEGMVPLAPSFDTVGWFAADGAVLERVGDVLLPPAAAAAPLRLMLAEDAFALAGPEVAAALAPAVERVEEVLGDSRPLTLAEEGDLASWAETFRVCQAADIWATHGAWVRETRPAFGPGVAERFAAAARLGAEEIARARAARTGIAARLRDLVASRTVICLPTVPGAAPPCAATPADIDSYRGRALRLLCPAGLAGLPQVTLPLARIEGAPLGLSLIGWPDGDRALLAVARALFPANS